MKAKLIIIGGFLGAGKTTLLSSIAALLKEKGKTVGLITNDQAKGLVDTQILSTNGMPVREIAGSCFCCDFDGLMEAALYLKEKMECDIVIAEPVGSCTDLSATLMQPIKAYYTPHFELLPLIVLIDPVRLWDVWAKEENTHEGSGYIYLKQLEEADYLVVNKTDRLHEDERETLHVFLKEKFPNYPIRFISALSNSGVGQLLEAMLHDNSVGTRIAEVDYGIYAKGEACMGWYNAKFHVYHKNKALIPWAEFNIRLLEMLQAIFQKENIAIGHVKTFLKSGLSQLHANLTGLDHKLSLKGTPFSSSSAQMIVNIRTETNSEFLKEIMNDIIDLCTQEDILFDAQIINHLTPKPPVPTYRLTEQVQ